MKHLVVLFLLISSLAFSQSKGIQFDSKIGDYGTLKYGEPAELQFGFVNKSNEDVTIRKVKSNSRSITFKIKDSIVKPGQRSWIKVFYKTEEEGLIRRKVTVFTTGNTPIHTLSLRGRVLKD